MQSLQGWAGGLKIEIKESYGLQAALVSIRESFRGLNCVISGEAI